MQRFIKYLLIFIFSTVLLELFLYSRPPKAKAENQNPPLSCTVHSFLVDSSYTLPFKYQSPELAGGSWVNTGDSIVYLFEIQNNTGQERVTINKVTTTQLLGIKEPIEIIQVRPINGSCSTNPENKSITCNTNYSFVESAHYPIEYLFRITDNPNNYPKTSSLFTIETDRGNTSCASLLWIKNTLAKTDNRVSWETPYASLSSRDFFIQIGDQKFYGKDPIRISSDPGTDKTTLETSWQENGVEMRLFIYFKKMEGKWEMYEMRTYNARAQGDWIYYKDSTGETIGGAIGQPNYSVERKFIPTNGAVDAQVYCKECRIASFMPRAIPVTRHGYSLEALIGLPKGEIITLTTDPNTGYGVNVLLRDSEGNIVKDQADFSYLWEAQDPSIVKAVASALDYGSGCAYEINKPCPKMHTDLSGKNPGETKILVSVKRNFDNAEVARTSFEVRVKAFGSTNKLESGELERLRKEVERLSIDVESQKKSLNTVEQIVQNIKSFLSRIFGRIF